MHTSASMPAAAVTWAGRPSVSAGSTMAMSARMQGSTTPTLFPVAGSVRTATNVASEPVPAVVGISTVGSH
jgi:hypothetical protein